MLTSPDLQTVSSEESNDEQQHFSISILWRRKWIVALYCLICSAYVVVDKQRIVSSSKSTHITQPHIVKITIIPSSPSTFHNSIHDDKSPNKNYVSYDSMPAFFVRPLKDSNIMARLMSYDCFDGDDDDDDLCSRTGHLNLNVERAMDDSNASATIREIVQPQGFSKYDDNHDTEVTMCHIDDPVAFLVPRGGCSFQDKAINVITYPPIMEQKKQTDPKYCYIPITYLIIYDDQIEQQQQENEEEDVKMSNNYNTALSHLIRMRAIDGDANKFKDETPISLLYVSYETGIALKEAMRNQTRSNNDEFDDENGSLIINLNPGYTPDVGGSNRKHHRSFNDDTADDFIDDNYYPVESSSEAAILVHMVTVMSLMFTFFVCIGCWIVCCCGPPGEGGGFFTIRMDRNGFVFGRPASNDAEGAARLLTEEEVLMLDEIEFFMLKNDNDDSTSVGFDSSGFELEDGLNNVNNREDITELVENPPSSCEKLQMKGNRNTKSNDDSIASSSSITRTPPLHHQISSSSLNRESLNWNAMCSICLEDFEEGEKLRMLPCHHLFHTECVLPWLTERFSNCPLCKAQIIPEDVEEESTTVEVREDESNTLGDEVALTNEGGLNETDGQEAAGLSLRNLFFGLSQNFASNRIDNRNEIGQRQIRLLNDNEISSNLSTPLIQDSTSQ